MNKRFIKHKKKRSPLDGLEIHHILRIQGKTIGNKKYKIGWRSEGDAFHPRDLAFYLMSNQRLINGWNHRKWDIFHALVEQLPGATQKDIDDAWTEFFCNDREFIEKLFKERNTRQREFLKIGDELKIAAEGMINHFARLPLPVKYSFIYYLVQIAYQGKYEDIQTEVNQNIPIEAKKWVDDIINNKNKDIGN